MQDKPSEGTRPIESTSSIKVSQVLRSWPESIRAVLGLFVCATIAMYATAIFVTIVGAGPNTMVLWKGLGFNIALLMIVNLLAYKKRAFWLVNSIYIGIGFAGTLAEMLLVASPGKYPAFWKGYFMILVGSMLNAWLSRSYCESVID